jgi:hypothetical protein
LLEKIKAIYMHGLIARHGDNLTYGGTSANTRVLGVQVAKSSAKHGGLCKLIIRKRSEVSPIQNLVIHDLGKMVINTKSQQCFIGWLEWGWMNGASIIWEKRWLETRNERIVRNNGRTIHIFVIVNTRCVGIGFFAKLEGGAKVYKIGIMLDRESSLENIVLEG